MDFEGMDRQRELKEDFAEIQGDLEALTRLQMGSWP